MEELKTNKIPSQGVNDDIDFWKDAREFLESQLPDDFEEKLKTYANEKGFNMNEFMLFEEMLCDAIGLHNLRVRLKHYVIK